MEGDFQSGKSINTKMKEINKNKINCLIKNFWDSVEEMNKDLFIDLEKQEITRLSTGNKLKFTLSGSKKNNNQYYTIDIKRKKLKVHRLFFYHRHGYLPNLVDHKDRNRINNNIENLRELTKSENSRNADKMKTETTSKYKGVCWVNKRKRWEARVQVNGKSKFLGYFKDEDEAGEIVNIKIREYGLEEVSVMNDTPQERARMSSLFNEPEPILNLK